MTIFVAHAPADREAAEALEKFIERRGQFAELDDGQTAMRPVQVSDVLVLLISKDLVLSPTRLRLEQRALDAWAEGRLIVVKMDQGIAPVGLRDLPAIDASFVAQREFTWIKVADAIRDRLKTNRGARDGTSDAPTTRDEIRPSKGGGRSIWLVIGLSVLALPGIVVGAALVSIWLVNRIGPRPGGWPELLAGVDAFGARYGLPSIVTEAIFVAAIMVTLAVLLVFVARLFFRGKRSEAHKEASLARPAPQEGAAPSSSEPVFVSYARANKSVVMPVIEAARREGHKFWLDQQSLSAGETWAGEIVRAIRGATEVIVMCSKAAFESDHVKREIYLADKYHKKLVPVFIEDAAPPEDFEYFFAGVQFLKLFDTPEVDRPRALMAALGDAA